MTWLFRLWNSRQVKPALGFKGVDLFLISFLALYFEMVLIRWFPSMVQVVAYFTNVILLASFLGLGLGCLTASERFNPMAAFPLALLVLTSIGVGFSSLPIAANITTEYLLGSYSSGGYPYLTLLLVIFALTTLLFVILGQVLGKAFGQFKPLVAYSINILGSIAGILLFWWLSSLATSPLVWFSIGILLSLWFVLKIPRYLALSAICFLLMLSMISQSSQGKLWSPYYRIEIGKGVDRDGRHLGFNILVNQIYHQYALNFSEETKGSDFVQHARVIYGFPYRFVHPEDLLVIGAGSGNDVTVALAHGVKRVDAVEVDPIIGSMGQWLHPHRPYLNGNVKLIIDDARSYLNKTDKRYDLIVFAYLDAHRLVSSFSTVRLDNFIYTVESFREAQQHLQPNGMLVVTFFVFKDWVAGRVQDELKAVFGDNLRTFSAQMYAPNDTVIFFAGPAAKSLPTQNADGIVEIQGSYSSTRIPMATDDWPYLYILGRSIPQHYLVMLLAILVFSLVMLRTIGTSQPQETKEYALFFLLGAAFMLMETKSITRFSLLYGSTWIVNLVVITSILVGILIANAIAARYRLNRLEPWYVLLALAIIVEWQVNPSAYLSFHRFTGLMLSSLVLGFPLFCAGVIFARSLRAAKDSTRALAYNLEGAVVGGLLEYSSMVLGFQALSLIILALYGASYVAFRKSSIGQSIEGDAGQAVIGI